MPKKRLDNMILEVIAETICGSGQGAGGGAAYGSPGHYRSKSEICTFFTRAGVAPQGQSSTRKWFTLESLQSANTESLGSIVTSSIEKILLRLADPKEYRGDINETQAVIDHINQVLQTEGLEIILAGVMPQLREKRPTATPPKRESPSHEIPPDFNKLVGEPNLASILTFRWKEAQKCIDAGTYLSSVIMMGSILEGTLLYKVENCMATACKAKSAPKDKSGKPRSISEWGLSALIDVAHEVGWLQCDVKRFSHSLRESRNIVHPYAQRLYMDTPDKDTCSICWQVMRAAVADLLGDD